MNKIQELESKIEYIQKELNCLKGPVQKYIARPQDLDTYCSSVSEYSYKTIYVIMGTGKGESWCAKEDISNMEDKLHATFAGVIKGHHNNNSPEVSEHQYTLVFGYD